MTVSPIILDTTTTVPKIIDLSVPCASVEVTPPVVQAGFGAAGMLLIGGLAIGMLLMTRRTE